MRQRRKRVHGPYKHGNRWRVVVVYPDGTRDPLAFDSEEEARAFVRSAHRELAGEDTIEDTVDRFELWLESTGAKPVTVRTARERLVRFFAGEMDIPVRRLTSARAAALYDRLRERFAVQTHRHTLAEAKRFARWCLESGLLRSNPLTAVKPLGRPRRGKPQLRVDEARALLDAVWQAFDSGDGRALMPAVCLLTGLRAGEVARLEARDVDDGGRLLWVAEAKTDAGRRVQEVPDPLQARLAAHARDRGGQLFPGATRHSVHHHCDRLCAAAGIPKVGPHGLRGTYATLSTTGGTSPEALMRALGQTSVTVARRHYVAPGALESARARAGWRVIEGGAGNFSPVRVPNEIESEPAKEKAE